MPCASGAQAHCGAPCRVPGARDAPPRARPGLAPPAALRPPGAPGLGPLRPAGRSCWAHAGAGKAGSFRPAVARDEVQLLLTTRYCVQLRPRLLLTLTFRGRGDARPHRQGPRDPRRLHVRPPSRRVPASRKRGRKAPGRIAPRKPPGATPTAAYTSLARTWDLAAGRQEARFASSQQVLVRSRGGMGVSRLCQMVWKLRWETRHRPRLPGPAGCLATRDHVGGHLCLPPPPGRNPGCIGGTCPLPRPSPARADPPGGPPQGWPARGHEDAGASDVRECGRRRILCKGPRASGVSGGPGEQPAHQVGRLAPC